MDLVRPLAILATACLASIAQDRGTEWRRLALDGGGALDYAVVLPERFDPARQWPVLLALPPGRQDRETVDAGLQRYWGAHARAHGFVVVSPAAPTGGETFASGAERHLPALLRRIRIDFRVEHNRVHLAGASNGGRSAFRLATRAPHEFASLTVLPGHASDDDVARLVRLRGIVVTMWVGGADAKWLADTETTAARLRELDVDTTVTVLPGEGHVPPSLDDGTPMRRIAELHARAAPGAGAAADVARALDDFHDAAAKGDEARYFPAFTDDAVFLGTDAGERWTRDQFVAFAAPYFARESAWIYVPQSRHVGVDEQAGYAWFDEALGHASYGVCRGTGTMRRVDGRWRVLLYDLTIPVPNDLAGTLVAMARDHELGLAPAVTTIWIVRHAEKEASGDDPGLTEAGRARAQALARMLRSVSIDGIWATHYRRTQNTVAPIASARSLTPRIVDGSAVRALAAELRQERGKTLLVAGHSNTVPPLLRELGVANPPAIGDDQYDDLFVVTLDPVFGTRMARLSYAP
jgi:phosphohistidine phosphatase SixA/dienelactone hydrolase